MWFLGTLHALYKTKGSSIEYENIIFEVDFLGAGAADLCAGEFLVPLAAGKLLPPICVQEQEEGYDVLKQCLSQMEDLCASREKGYELGVKGGSSSTALSSYKKISVCKRSVFTGPGATKNGAA